MAVTEQTERLNAIADALDDLGRGMKSERKTLGDTAVLARPERQEVDRLADGLTQAVGELGRQGVLSSLLEQSGDAGFSISRVRGELESALNAVEPALVGRIPMRRDGVEDKFKAFEAFSLVQSGVPWPRAKNAVAALRSFRSAQRRAVPVTSDFGLLAPLQSMRQQISQSAAITLGRAVRIVTVLKKITVLGLVIEVDGQFGDLLRGRYEVIGAVSQHMATASALYDQSLLVDPGA